MQTLKAVLGVLAALVPVVYCAGLVYYFLDQTGSVREADAIGLGPTVLGLTIVGLLFSIPLIVKVVRLLIGLLSPAARDGAAASAQDGAFDADATLARYMARQAADASSTASPEQGGGPATRPTFGRKVK